METLQRQNSSLQKSLVGVESLIGKVFHKLDNLQDHGSFMRTMQSNFNEMQKTMQELLQNCSSSQIGTAEETQFSVETFLQRYKDGNFTLEELDPDIFKDTNIFKP